MKLMLTPGKVAKIIYLFFLVIEAISKSNFNYFYDND